MTLSPGIRRAVLAIVVLLLLWLAWAGLSGGVAQVPQSQTFGQYAQTITQLGFGLCALLLLITTFWAPRWSRLARAGWTASLTLAAGMASVVWGGTSLVIGLVSGGAGLLVALGIAWMLRAGARGLTNAWSWRAPRD
jgi:hypothetical protein